MFVHVDPSDDTCHQYPGEGFPGAATLNCAGCGAATVTSVGCVVMDTGMTVPSSPRRSDRFCVSPMYSVPAGSSAMPSGSENDADAAGPSLLPVTPACPA